MADEQTQPVPEETPVTTAPVQPQEHVAETPEAEDKPSDEGVDNAQVEGADAPGDEQRKEGETQAEYNERVPVAVQPVLPPVEHTYLGDKR